jgi:hypothetical protein
MSCAPVLQVYVDQPTVSQTVSILRGLKERYEVHHGVRISDNALVEAAVLSDRYLADRCVCVCVCVCVCFPYKIGSNALMILDRMEGRSWLLLTGMREFGHVAEVAPPPHNFPAGVCLTRRLLWYITFDLSLELCAVLLSSLTPCLYMLYCRVHNYCFMPLCRFLPDKAMWMSLLPN